jgi:hypothetical protein
MPSPVLSLLPVPEALESLCLFPSCTCVVHVWTSTAYGINKMLLVVFHYDTPWRVVYVALQQRQKDTRRVVNGQ